MSPSTSSPRKSIFHKPYQTTSRMSARPSQAAMLPYRDETGVIRYAIAPAVTLGANASDSDGEPLLSSSNQQSDLDEEALQHFTATGRPIPTFKHNGLQSLGGDMFTMPQLLPRQYTDDSIIPAIVTGVVPIPKAEGVQEAAKPRRKSFVKILTGERAALDKKKEGSDKGITKVVFMPRREYLKFFARDLNGAYIGSEPFKQWTEEELNSRFAQYRPPKMEKRGRRM